ncbi:MAG TPA: hypothetical protein VN203_24645, partial [Candidatus Acidoferrum sp.]|nr:hypothetical protein [Candidatus Acidoferrum sp.]
FGPPLVHKEREVVKNPKQGKNGAFYEDGLRKIYSECHRVLKDDGLLVFTFHHKTTEAWSSVLRAVLDGGFLVTAVYPVHSELPLSVHFRQVQSMPYDSILVCRKRLRSTRSTWTTVEAEIRERASRVLTGLQADGRQVSLWNRYVVVLGKCLERYSLSFPEVFDIDGSPVSVDEAVTRMVRLADGMTDGWMGENVKVGPEMSRVNRRAGAGGGSWQ